MVVKNSRKNKSLASIYHLPLETQLRTNLARPMGLNLLNY